MSKYKVNFYGDNNTKLGMKYYEASTAQVALSNAMFELEKNFSIELEPSSNIIATTGLISSKVSKVVIDKKTV